ncbi:hypothetical protein GJAV_G00268500 [Gymnothorax javanicus]|nr:hypothetical protein GJAV_G00268500 [Gymnothorax javanicus]
MHGQRQPGGPPGAQQAEKQDSGGAGADWGHARNRPQSRGTAAAATPFTRAGPHQEPAATEIQEPVHVRHPQTLGPPWQEHCAAGGCSAETGPSGNTLFSGHNPWMELPWSSDPQPCSWWSSVGKIFILTLIWCMLLC